MEEMWTCDRCRKTFDDDYKLFCKVELDFGWGDWINLTLCEECQKEVVKWYKSVRK